MKHPINYGTLDCLSGYDGGQDTRNIPQLKESSKLLEYQNDFKLSLSEGLYISEDPWVVEEIKAEQSTGLSSYFKKMRSGSYLYRLGYILGLSILAFFSISSCFQWSRESYAQDISSSTDVIQLVGPLPDLGAPVASQTLVNYVFGNSYGNPFVGSYTPPNASFTHVRLSVSGSCYGRQFDRLSHFYIGGREIWRSSTPEPSNRNITWSFTKDVSDYASLFTSPQTIALDLGNIVNDIYTGPFTVTLVADFYSAQRQTPQWVADSYSHHRSPDSAIALLPANASNAFSWSSPSNDLNVPVPALAKNTTRAVLEVFASGNNQEEFWSASFSDELSADTNTTAQRGPARIIRVFVDGVLAGVALPFPIIYSGGYAPTSWSNIVGINIYEIPSYKVDLTPFLPNLWAGADIRVDISNGYNDDVSDPVLENWIVNANLLTWNIDGVEGSGKIVSNSVTTSNITRVVTAVQDLTYYQVVHADYLISNRAELIFSHSFSNSREWISVEWQQSANFSNVMEVSNYLNTQYAAETSNGLDQLIISSGSSGYSRPVTTNKYSYPFLIRATTPSGPSGAEDIRLFRVYDVANDFHEIQNTQNATSVVVINGSTLVYGYGGNTENLTQVLWQNNAQNLYARDTAAWKYAITYDNTYTPAPPSDWQTSTDIEIGNLVTAVIDAATTNCADQQIISLSNILFYSFDTFGPSTVVNSVSKRDIDLNELELLDIPVRDGFWHGFGET